MYGESLAQRAKIAKIDDAIKFSWRLHKQVCGISALEIAHARLSLYAVLQFAVGSTVLVNPLKTKRRLLYLKTQFVPCSKHFSSRL